MPVPGEPMNPSSLATLALLATAISVAAVLVALDARDRGLSRGFCVLWSLGVQLFFPLIFIYLFFRNSGASQRPAPLRTTIAKLECPYCGKPHDEGARLCSGCGRFL